MPTFVRQYPQASTEQALHESIHGPKGSSSWCGRDSFRSHIVVENIEGGGQRRNVSGDVCKSTSSRALKTVCWDGIPDLLYGIIWHLELIAIGVEHLPVDILQVQSRVRAERG